MQNSFSGSLLWGGMVLALLLSQGGLAQGGRVYAQTGSSAEGDFASVFVREGGITQPSPVAFVFTPLKKPSNLGALYLAKARVPKNAETSTQSGGESDPFLPYLEEALSSSTRSAAPENTSSTGKVLGPQDKIGKQEGVTPDDQDLFLSSISQQDWPAGRKSPLHYKAGRFFLLDRLNGKTVTFDLEEGQTYAYGSILVTLRSCQEYPPEMRPESGAFLEVRDKNSSETLFSGWMFALSPNLSALEHPSYDIQLKACLK